MELKPCACRFKIALFPVTFYLLLHVILLKVKVGCLNFIGQRGCLNIYNQISLRFYLQYHHDNSKSQHHEKQDLSKCVNLQVQLPNLKHHRNKSTCILV